MVQRVSRRDFMRTLLSTGAGMYGLSLSPNVASAQAAHGFRVLVRLEMLGGCDSHSMWLPLDGARFSALAARRPEGMFASTPSGALDIGFGQGIGFHPALSPLIPHVPQMRLFMNTSNDLARGQTGSHENAQNIMTIGTRETAGKLRGWTGAIFDNEPSCKLITFLGARGANGNCDSTTSRCAESPPPTIDTFETFRFDGYSFDSRFGGANNSRYIANVVQRLAEARSGQEPPSVVEGKFGAAMRAVFPAVEQVQETLSYQSPLYASYGASKLSQQLRNIAMKIQQMVAQGSSERIIFVLGIGSFDFHDRWAIRTEGLMSDLGSSLGVFMSDINAMSAADNVVVVSGTEFGRTIATNGAGTDHGQASTTMVLGGRVRGGSNAVFGDLLTPTEFSSLTVSPARMDNRGVISSVLNDFMGISHESAFPGPVSSEFTIGNYNLFS